MSRSVLVTGGGGFAGSALVPRLLATGRRVRVLDLFFFGEEALEGSLGHPALEVVRGDLRDPGVVARAVDGMDAVIHLACISNDPSFDLDPALGRSINFDAFEPLVDASVRAGVSRFVYASSSSVYGVSDAPKVTEDHPLAPLTDYSRFKALCEPILLSRTSARFAPVVLRPATLCGWAPRLRLDLTVNILTSQAWARRRITVFGGRQMRPNLHVDDMTDLYLCLLDEPAERIAGRVWNVGRQNLSVAETAEIARRVVGELAPEGGDVEIETRPSKDERSYRIDADRIARDLGFVPARSVEDAVRDLVRALADGRVRHPIGDERYHNVERLRRVPPPARETAA